MKYYALFFLAVAATLVCAEGQTTLPNNLSGQPQNISTVDSGFQPKFNGFSFQNYGNEIQTAGLTPAEMQRMFGDGVIASRSGDKILLTPPAERWMNMANEAMAYGHCEGMAVLSVLMYYNKVSPLEFEGNETIDLSLQKELLQREIAYWWSTQVTSPGGSVKVRESPNAVLDTLKKAFEGGQNITEWWVLGIFKPDRSGGHSITPIAVEDINNSTAEILVYDNNFPKDVKAIVINKTANTWSYYASINPNEPSSLYIGNASTRSLEVVSISSRLGQQRCDFCAEGKSTSVSGSKGSLAGGKQTQVWLDGDADLLITDNNSSRIGVSESGQLINEIPGADVRNLTFVETTTTEPKFVYSVPAYTDYGILLDGSRLSEPGSQSLWVFGPGSVIGILNTPLSPGEQDHVDMIWQGNDNLKVTYTTMSKEKTIDLLICLKSNKPGDNTYVEAIIKGVKVDENGQVSFGLDLAKNELTFYTSNISNPGNLQLVVRFVDETGERFFANDNTQLQEGDLVVLDLANADEGNGILSGEIIGKDGTKESVTLENEYNPDLESNQDYSQEQSGVPKGRSVCVDGVCDIKITVNVD